jgi:two-component system OmpR family sensor kinase
MFASFQRRLTGGYVILAVLLIVGVVAATSVLAFVLYAHEVNDALTGASQRATDIAAQYASEHRSLEAAAPIIAHKIARGRFHVAVFDDRRRLLAENEPPELHTAGRAVLASIGGALGLAHARIPVSGGTVYINADFDRFGSTLLWYWSIVLPIGVLAVIVAWLIGRRITARAIGPLVDVTRSLQTIAAGDLERGKLISSGGELRDLTTAYNDVVLRLASATAERRQTESQMRQFIADAGHELRTPLTVIMGYLDLLRSGGLRADRSGAERAYETMLEESRRMRGLIERLILLARLDRPPAEERKGVVDIRALAARAARAVSPVDTAQRVTVRDGAVRALTFGDEAELYEAIKNIIDNAVKYAPNAPVDVSVERDDATVTLYVNDAGPGMDPQDLAHAFDRFYRGSGKYDVEGSGLGLAIAKRAVERAGGSLDLQSAAGEGTRVTMKLPALSENSQHSPV